jgi:ubiquinone/menaquinone biosynthesis C-methylase UbiE
MSGPLDMATGLAANAVRFGWFYGLNQLVDREVERLGAKSRYRPQRAIPSKAELLAELRRLLAEDAAGVGEGILPPLDVGPETLAGHLARVRAMFADLPRSAERRVAAEAHTARDEPGATELPAYYAQDFHFQTGGYLSEQSARLYDVQVETLFYGSAMPMRRTALRPIASYMRGRDQRRVSLLDVACGTGRLLRQIRLGWPALGLTGLDLSHAYLDEARRHMGDLRSAHLVAGNAEAIPLPDASQDIVAVAFLYHELPGDVRLRVTAEIARVLKPGGVLAFLDSMQIGDRPGWDGLLEAFPVRFHEPYFRGYAIDDLDRMFADAGLADEHQSLAFLSKLMVRRKA